jgi:hypothetical protein
MLINELTAMRNRLVDIGRGASALDASAGGEEMTISRMLDSIIENAAYARAVVERRAPSRRDAFMRRVRKALGYTTP